MFLTIKSYLNYSGWLNTELKQRPSVWSLDIGTMPISKQQIASPNVVEMCLYIDRIQTPNLPFG